MQHDIHGEQRVQPMVMKASHDRGSPCRAMRVTCVAMHAVYLSWFALAEVVDVLEQSLIVCQTGVCEHNTRATLHQSGVVKGRGWVEQTMEWIKHG